MKKEEKMTREERFYQEVALLFRRFNFFLVTTSFLVAAFVTLVTSDLTFLNNVLYVHLVHAIVALASFLSVVFFLINYLATTWLDKLVNKEDQPKEDNPIERLYNFPKDIVDFLLNPMNFSVQHKACHTWVIPLVLYVFWMAAWWISSSWIGPFWFSVGLLVIFILYIWTGKRNLKLRDRMTLRLQKAGFVLGIVSSVGWFVSFVLLVGLLKWPFVLLSICGLVCSIIGMSIPRVGRRLGIAGFILCLHVIISFGILHTMGLL